LEFVAAQDGPWGFRGQSRQTVVDFYFRRLSMLFASSMDSLLDLRTDYLVVQVVF
jgi:hypothetical protein